MTGDELLDLSRTVTLLVRGDGTILTARGGHGGFLGLDVAAMAGTSVFDHIDPDEIDVVAAYFLENEGLSADTVALPMPFRIGILDPDGRAQPVDVVPTGRRLGDERMEWVVVLVPVDLNGSTSRSFDLELGGAGRDAVREMLCRELLVDNDSYSSRWSLFDVDRDGRLRADHVAHSERVITDAIVRAAADGWHPWDDGAVHALGVADTPVTVQAALAVAGWTRMIVAPVAVRGTIDALFVMVGTTPPSHPPDLLASNVAGRIQGLVRTTSLLLERWRDQDQLERDARTDHLTGLCNVRELRRHLDAHQGDGALLYVDIDHFKAVNDTWGHRAGDRVLEVIGARIVSVCRDGDVVARIGGDEFVVLLAGADAQLAERIAERIVERAREPLEVGEGPSSVTVSVGQTHLGHHDPIHHADRAMLDAKRAGRARHVRVG